MTDLSYIQNEMILYGMSAYFALGIIGNICNCIMFTRPNCRRTATSMCLVYFSVFAIIYLSCSIVPYFYTLNHVDPTTQSLFYCKIRLYVTHVLGQYLRFCIVIVCIDRFLATRTDARFRAFSSIKSAKTLIIIMCFVCPLIAMHLPILMQIRNNVCDQFGLYKLLYAIYQLIIVGLLPPILMSIFSVLTIRTLRQRHDGRERARQRDRYLLKMVIAEVVVDVFVSIPYSANLVYNALTFTLSKSTERIAVESFVSFITLFLIYLISVAPFYVFLITSKRFRKEFFSLIVTYWHKLAPRPVRIGPSVH